MNQHIDTIRKTRTFLLGIVKDLTLEQLNKIPQGFNNNIVWNLAHLVASQQGLCYTRSGLPTIVSEVYVNSYKSGSRPEKEVGISDLEEMKGLFFSTLDQLEMDYKNQVFTNYVAWTTRYGVELASVDQALEFMLFHEGLHMGYIMSLKRVVSDSK